jgi:hypothetical protein
VRNSCSFAPALLSRTVLQTLAQITQAASGDAFERLISKTIWVSYGLLTPPRKFAPAPCTLLIAEEEDELLISIAPLPSISHPPLRRPRSHPLSTLNASSSLSSSDTQGFASDTYPFPRSFRFLTLPVTRSPRRSVRTTSSSSLYTIFPCISMSHPSVLRG